MSNSRNDPDSNDNREETKANEAYIKGLQWPNNDVQYDTDEPSPDYVDAPFETYCINVHIEETRTCHSEEELAEFVLLRSNDMPHDLDERYGEH